MSTLALTRVPIIRNKHHQRNGFKSYNYALQKYGITPTKPGPYFNAAVAGGPGKLAALKEKLRSQSAVAQQLLGSDQSQQHDHVQQHGHGHQHDLHHQSKVSDTSSQGYIPADDIQHDAEYICPVEIGNPPQKLMLDFDTGSADLWVWSTELSPNVLSKYGSQHNVFDPTKSDTYKPKSGFTWKIQYGDSSTASGNIGNDDVILGGLKIPFQAIELAQAMSSQFQQGAGDGLLGLAWGNINTAKPRAVHTPVENMIRTDEIPKSQELFTAYLGSYKDVNEADKGNSFYTFGYIDQPTLTAAGVKSPNDIYYTDIDHSNGFWEFDSTQAAVNGHIVTLPGNTAIADTGTTLALVSDKVCEAVYSQIPGAQYSNSLGGYLFPNGTSVSQLPDVQFAVGNRLFSVQKEDLAFADAGNGYVYGGIQSRGNMPLDILGDTFLKGIYAIFDQGKTRFGAVQRIEQVQNLSTH